VLDLAVQRLERTPKKDWRKLNEKAYTEVLNSVLPPLRRPKTKAALDAYVERVTAAIQVAINRTVPQIRPSPHAREGWTEECKAVLAEAKRLKRVYGRCHTEESWEAYRAARNHKARTIRKALRKAHRDRVEKAVESPEALWKLAKWARTRHSQPSRSIPALQHPDTQFELVEPSDKAELFRDVFFHRHLKQT
jgi:hypothetical protein